MPKRYGAKEKDQVVDHIIGQLLIGKLRTGERIDRNEIARELSLSRLPVTEAIGQLEHDGIVTSRYHRGSFVERFDPATVLEHHEVYGVLSGMASARAAVYPTPRIIDTLSELVRELREACGSERFEQTTWAYRRAINYEYAGPRLQAAIRASQSFIPAAFWVNYKGNQAIMLPYYELEHAAILRRDPVAARAACEDRSTTMARVVVAELVRRGVFESAQGVTPTEAMATR
ncbi:GntR family transcriptional regulator [Mycobacterium sp. CVI_P3]|uniref:GntR family transcriptional regulator n=1 Tax=Mycobacterium pinniadriaticum TaxID=2994102 RepID=A0ABT3SMU8_9MYCO|nr:GntR family transcriptional regulator [Mycobacterium pinniadriaticum]MCX2934433.1 GntR family transcriptional regulator [Mycobacterium pinniadriaticum]MCX2940856.1 GntR family transcriptional regulator [Mycobacterium pinniadriaticum]